MNKVFKVEALLDKLKNEILAIVEEAEAGNKQFSQALEDYSDILDVKDVMEITEVHRCTVYRWIKTGRLKAFSSGSRKKVLKRDLVSFICSQELGHEE